MRKESRIQSFFPVFVGKQSKGGMMWQGIGSCNFLLVVAGKTNSGDWSLLPFGSGKYD